MKYNDIKWEEISGNTLPEISNSGDIRLPNGSTLYWKVGETTGCRYYFSDEVGGNVFVWDTALVDQSTLLAAIVQENAIKKLEYIKEERESRKSLDSTLDEIRKSLKNLNDGKPIC